MKPTNEERKAWVAFMAAAMTLPGITTHTASLEADDALEEYRKRFPAVRAAYDMDPA